MASAVKQFAVSVDQTMNTLWYIHGEGFGMADEMISARAMRAHLQGLIDDKVMNAINMLFFWQRNEQGVRNHCHRAWRSEWDRNQLPNHYRDSPCS